MTDEKLPILVALLYVSTRIFLASCCGDHAGLYVAHYHKAMIGHTFLSRPRTSRVQCMMLCSRHSRCLSFNHEDTNGTCQLNSGRTEEFPKSLQQDVGFSYFGGPKSRAQGTGDTTTVDEQLSTDSAEATTTSSSTDCNCCNPLGMESGAILDHQITAGSVLNNDNKTYGPPLARLNSPSAWCGDGWAGSWIQVTFNQTVSIYGLIVQGLYITGSYIATFSLTFDAEASWDYSREQNSFAAWDAIYHDVLVQLPHVVRSTFIRIHTTGWTNDECIRFEILGCL